MSTSSAHTISIENIIKSSWTREDQLSQVGIPVNQNCFVSQWTRDDMQEWVSAGKIILMSPWVGEKGVTCVTAMIAVLTTNRHQLKHNLPAVSHKHKQTSSQLMESNTSISCCSIRTFSNQLSSWLSYLYKYWHLKMPSQRFLSNSDLSSFTNLHNLIQSSEKWPI